MKDVKSSKPKKQRKFHFEKPSHKKQAGLCGHLDKKLAKQLGMRSLALRKGDEVKVLRGKKSGSSGKVTGVNYEKGTIIVEKLVRKKVSGEEIPWAVHASNVLVTGIDKSDARRFRGKTIERESEEEKPVKKEKQEEKETKEEKEKHERKEREEKEAGKKDLKKESKEKPGKKEKEAKEKPGKKEGKETKEKAGKEKKGKKVR